jgi:hypothetical protein
MAVEYLDPSIAGEGTSCNNWTPGAWANTPNTSEDEWQPDIEPPHIQDYAAFKKHKHYGKYFRPYRYQPFPAWMYHATLDPKLVKSKEEVIALGAEWSPVPNKPRVDMTGKSLPVKSDTQRLAEVIAQSMKPGTVANAAIDPTAIAAIVAAVLAATQKPAAASAPIDEVGLPEIEAHNERAPHDDLERKALLELAEKEGIDIDRRWSSARIKKELGL